MLRTINQYGMQNPPHSYANGTGIEAEAACMDYGQFRRKAIAVHSVTGKLVKCRGDIPDTYFSIPATTDTEHGYLTGNDKGELEFRPHTEQNETPAQFRAKTRKAYR